MRPARGTGASRGRVLPGPGCIYFTSLRWLMTAVWAKFGARLLRRHERRGIPPIGFEPLVFDLDAAYTGWIVAFGMRRVPVLR